MTCVTALAVMARMSINAMEKDEWSLITEPLSANDGQACAVDGDDANDGCYDV